MSILWWSSLLVAAYSPVSGLQWQCHEGTGRGRVDVVVGAGALHESEDARGVAHLLEHLLFRKGNFSYRHENGRTSLDFTHFYRTTTSAELPTAAEALLAEIATPSFTTEDVTVERKVVIKELQERGLARASGADPMFGGTPLARGPGGTERDVRGLSYEDALDFHRKFYGRGNVAIRIVNAPSCEGMKNRLETALNAWPQGPPAELPTIDRKEPGPVTVPSARFNQGYFWYQSDPLERLLWVAVGQHFRLEALRELRQNRGLIYTPDISIQTLGPGGIMSLVMDVGDNGREVAQWFDETVIALKTEPRVTAHLADAFQQVSQWLDEHPEVAALAAIRGEPDPKTLLDKLRRNVPQPALKAMLIERRRFGSDLPQSNILSLIILGLFGAGVLAVLFYTGRQFLDS